MPRKPAGPVEVLKDREILSMNQAAKLVGIHKSIIKAGLETGEIPARFIGNRWRIYKQDVIDWIRAGNQPVNL